MSEQNRALTLFNEASGLPIGERLAYLRRECRDEPELLEAVLEMLELELIEGQATPTDPDFVITQGGASPLPTPEELAASFPALDIVGLSSRIHHRPSQLSGGQQQRVAVARALVGKPQLILADEPTGNLDTAMANEIRDLLEKINQIGATVVVVTHDPEMAARAGRQLYVLDGRLIDVDNQERPTPLYQPEIIAPEPRVGT